MPWTRRSLRPTRTGGARAGAAQRHGNVAFGLRDAVSTASTPTGWSSSQPATDASSSARCRWARSSRPDPSWYASTAARHQRTEKSWLRSTARPCGPSTRTPLRDPPARRHRDPRALARRQRPDHGGAGTGPAACAGPRRRLASRSFRSYVDGSDVVRLVVPVPGWDRVVGLAFTEIAFYGSDAPQISRKLTAVFDDLAELVGPDRIGAIDLQRAALREAVRRAAASTRRSGARGGPARPGIGAPAVTQSRWEHVGATRARLSRRGRDAGGPPGPSARSSPPRAGSPRRSRCGAVARQGLPVATPRPGLRRAGVRGNQCMWCADLHFASSSQASGPRVSYPFGNEMNQAPPTRARVDMPIGPAGGLRSHSRRCISG